MCPEARRSRRLHAHGRRQCSPAVFPKSLARRAVGTVWHTASCARLRGRPHDAPSTPSDTGRSEPQPCGRSPAQSRIRRLPDRRPASSSGSSLAVGRSKDSMRVLGRDRPRKRFGQLQQLQGRLRVADLLLDRVQKRQLGRPPGGVDFSCTSHLQPFVLDQVAGLAYRSGRGTSSVPHGS